MPPMNTVQIPKEGNDQIPLEPANVPVKAKENAPPKVDRPRPHVCSICTRSFARLEHLKRHERSHTKEKPFECPECLRCFARRDLLLRHQQKLHLTTTPSSRPRNGVRRESTSSVAQPAGSRVRKNSVSNAGGRPRANTIAHVDSNTLSLLAKSTTGGNQNLPKLETGSLRGLNVVGTSLGASTVVPQDLDIEGILFGNPTTVNPAVLQFSASPHANTFGSPTSPFEPVFGNSNAVIDDDDDPTEWMMLGTGVYTSEQAVESSSPSAISTTSISAVSEALQDTNTWWNNNASTLSSATTLSTSPFMSASDYNTTSFNPSPPPPAGTISPKALQAQGGNHHDLPFFANYSMSNISPNHFLSPESHFQPEMQHDFPHEYSGFQPATSAAHATQTITDSARAAILLTLAQSSNAYRSHQQAQHQRRYSSAQSPPLHVHRNSFTAQLPGTQDLQKYVQSYIKHFHPHMPFFHIATLDFSSPSYAVSQKKDNLLGLSGFAGGGGCLILSMSAIGALYAGEVSVAKEIYEAAKKMIHVFIDNRRKASVSAAVSGNGGGAQSTPLWLVQSMLLNVVFGLNSGEHMSSELALSHCTAVVSLARTAGLCRPYTNAQSTSHIGPDASMLDMWNGAMKLESLDDHADWIKWIAEEERKRTLYAVHKLSSMLCITYNHAPALTNSEIRLDLPCDEELWAAETATMWKMRGGIQAAKQAAVPFSMALNTLLSANHTQAQQERAQNREDHRYMGPHGKLKPSELRPSHFGALSLILALHVYIWETRQLSQSRQWSATEVEAVHAHIEPALRAWEEAWASHPQSSIERPSPFGIGPMAADSIPLLNLAYVRLFVDLGMSRGPLFARDFSGMIDELNKNWAEQPTTTSSANSSGSESADTPPGSNSSPASSPNSALTSPDLNPSKGAGNYQAPYPQASTISSRREKHIRRAAFYAADALAMSEKSGLSSPDFLARELPMQSLMCAFDCAQVLAEWVNAVQERVRPFMGKFGDAECDLMSIEALMMLENEDRVLLGRVIDILKKSHEKMVFEWDSIVGGNDEVSVSILRVSAHLLEKASVWPVMRVYSSALRYHADNIESRPKNTGILGLGH
ncbi:hypothetical protein TWF481_010089 [Arthrobotrys musiformis]|uniref:C2H2-type domain-containing protein n=1 Tax=Arthrobotrys musiformis TaxID=47236 RepID=A0AAV9VZW1_9PEZI